MILIPTCDISIIIPSFNRPQLLKWGLYSLGRQKIPYSFETIVLNDGTNDETEAVCAVYTRKLNLQYVFTGQRNLKGQIKRRVPGYAINIGARLARGTFLIICDAEMFHLNDTVDYLLHPLKDKPNCLGIPAARDDKTGYFLELVTKLNGQVFVNTCDRSFPLLNSRLPFLMSLSRNNFLAIGGYDEAFTGRGWEDNDLIARLNRYGCRHFQTKAQTIHLFHDRYNGDKSQFPEYIYNHSLFDKNNKEGRVVCNTDKAWGQIRTNNLA